MPNSSTLPELHALLVGINDYSREPRVSNLAGCLNDVARVRALLEKPYLKEKFRPGGIHILELGNPVLPDKPEMGAADGLGATKDNIVTAIKEHLGKAKAGDVVLFFFAGHGIREFTDIPAFREEEIDVNIGGLVCTDFQLNGSPGPYVLCDKELRYLIRQLAENEDGTPRAHVVTIFDCCHSGENTRSVLEEEFPPTSRQVQRSALSTPRKLEEFIFAQNPEIKRRIGEKRRLREILPLGNHVMLAACREVELAWESGGNSRNGAFTTALYEVLDQHKGNISYHELQSRILNRMRFNVLQGEFSDKRQTPQFYIHADNPGERYHSFLTNQPREQSRYCSVEYNEAEKEWRIDLGALHGIPINPDQDSTKLIVYPLSDRKKEVKAHVKRTFPTYSLIEFDEPFQRLDGEAYRGLIEGLMVSLLQVYVGGDKEASVMAKSELKARLEEVHTQLFEIIEDEGSADYVLFADNGRFQTRLPFEERPLLKPVSYDPSGSRSKTAFETIFNNFQQMARWSFLKELEYIPEAHIKASLSHNEDMYPVELRVFEYDKNKKKEIQIKPQGSNFTIELTKDLPRRLIRFELVNHSNEELFAGLVYMPFNFGFSIDEGSRIMKEAQMGLAKGGTLKSISIEKKENGEGYLPLVIERYVQRYNLVGEENFLKLIVSKTPFDLSTFHLDPLPTPDEEDTRGSRGFVKKIKEPDLPELEWEIRTFKLFITNPGYLPNT